jgi:hypothetical protein
MEEQFIDKDPKLGSLLSPTRNTEKNVRQTKFLDSISRYFELLKANSVCLSQYPTL